MFIFFVDWLMFGVNVVIYMRLVILLFVLVLVMIVLFYECFISMILFGWLLMVWCVVVMLLVSEFSLFCIVCIFMFLVCSSGIILV